MKRMIKDVLKRCSLLMGHRNLYRLSRFLMYTARGEPDGSPSGPLLHGEAMVQSVSLRTSVPQAIVFDVGANVGDWTASLLEIAGNMHSPVQVHAFEPCRGTFLELSERSGKLSGVVLNNQACSRQPGTAMMNVYGSGGGTNSLGEALDSRNAVCEEVQLTTIDLYCELNRIEKIDLLKIDAEGYDFEVIAGASKMLDKQAVGILQFEYNFRWIGCRNYLRDVFTLLVPKGYVIGKPVGARIEFYPYWQWELENWAEGNYIACLRSEVQHFPHSEAKWLLYNET